MIKLCGFPISNYYNKVKIALLEKRIPFEEERHTTGKDSIDAGSPLGKVPFLRTPQGVLCESQAIIEYIEETQPQPALWPRDAFQRAKCRELIDFIELYLELPARRLYPEVYFGSTVSDEIKTRSREELEKGIKAIAQTAKFSPYVAGAEFTYADCAAVVHFPLISQATKKIYGEDFIARLPQAAACLDRIKARASVMKVNDDRKAEVERQMAARKSA